MRCPAPSAPASARARALLAGAALLSILGAAGQASAELPASGASAASEASGAGDAVSPPSEAEKLLFLSPQLASIREPVTLRYDYVADESGQHTADHAALVLAKTSAGQCCTTHVDYRSGTAAIARPDLDDPRTNPVLLYFLVDQIQTLARTTHGQSVHFQRRIRQALADEAQVKDVTVRWQGQDVPAHAIHVAPFLNDPYRVRFEHEARTEYDFVLSDAVPGGVVRLTSTLPADKQGDPPQAQRTLTLVDSPAAAPARK